MSDKNDFQANTPSRFAGTISEKNPAIETSATPAPPGLDDINLGYTFRGVGRWETDMRLAFGVQNVFVLTGYSGMDPETVSENGIDNTMWPRPRTWSLRVNVNF